MATEDQTVPIDFGQGLDTKSDPRQVLPTMMSRLENRVFSKLKQLKKDFGFDRLTNETLDGGTVLSATHCTKFDDELLIVGTASTQIGHRLMAYSPSLLKWIDRGAISSQSVSVQDVIRNNATQSNCEVATAGNYSLHVWKDSRGGIRHSVKDLNTDAFIISDDILSLTGYFVKVLKVSSTTVIIYYCDGATIKYQSWSSASPTTLSAESTFVGSLSSTLPNVFDVHSDGTNFMMAYWNADAGSQRIFLAKINSSGALTSSNFIFTGVNFLTSIAVSKYDGVDIAFIVYSDPNAGEINLAAVTYSTLSLIANAFVDSDMDVGNYVPVAVKAEPSGFCTVIYSRKNFSGLSQFFSTYYREYDGTATPSSGVTLLHLSTCIYSKPFVVDSRTYIILQSYDDQDRYPTQPTYFLARVDGIRFIANRFLTNEAGAGALGIISEFAASGGTFNQFKATAASVAEVSSSRWLVSAQRFVDFSSDIAGGPVYTFGASEISIETPSDLSMSSTQVNKELLLSGPITNSYDGFAVAESGFHRGPDGFVAANSSTTTNQHFAIAVTNGTAGTPEVFTITVNCSAEYIESGSYFTFTTSSTSYYVLFYKAGSLLTADPAPGGTRIRCNLDDGWDKYLVANAIKIALSVIAGATTAISGNIITVTNTANGNVTSAVNVNVANGLITSGTRQYRAVYEWRDASGNVHLSPAQQLYNYDNNLGTLTRNPLVTWTGTGYGLVSYHNLSLTQKDTTTISIKIYRTTNGGSIYYLVSQVVYPTLNSVSTVSTGLFYDVLSDTAIQGRDVLYTTGGVLSNTPPPSSSAIIASKDRAWMIDQEADKVWYSKVLDEGFAAEFAGDLSISIDAKGDSLVTLGEMDDKVVLFKEGQPYYVYGDGPNDDGNGNQFNVPEPIISPVGASEKGSVIKSPMGLMFKSLKGIYLMGRDLSTAFIGAPVEDFNSSTVYSAEILPDLAQIRFLLSSDKFLIYDYDMQQWSSRTLQSTPVDAVVWNNKYAYAQSNGRVWVQNTGYQDNSTNVITLCETGWLNLNGLQGFQRVKRLILLGEYKSAHTVTVDVGYDYATSYDTTNNRYTFTPSGSAGDPLQFEIHLKQQKCEAIRIRITEGAVNGTLLEGNSWAHMQLIVGLKKGVNKLPATKKV